MTIDTTKPLEQKFIKNFDEPLKNRSKFMITKLNDVDYDLHRQNAKISALRSRELKKYKYLTGEDLGYRPDPVQKAKFEYSPLGQVFNKGLNFNERQEGLLKRLKNIENQTDNPLDLIRDQDGRQLDLIGKTSLGTTKGIEFQDEGLKNLKKEIDDKEKDIIKKSKSKDKEERKQAIFFIQQQIIHPLILMIIHT